MQDKELVEEIIGNLGKLTEKFGFGSSLGIVYGELYFNGDMTQDELKQSLNLALSSVSQSLVILESFGFIGVVGKDGRKNIYSTTLKTKKNVFENISMFHIEPINVLLKSRLNVIKEGPVKKKLASLAESCSKLNKQLRMLI